MIAAGCSARRQSNRVAAIENAIRLRVCPETRLAALLRVQRFTFNAAADCWPGWAEPDRPADRQNLLDALALAQRSAKLVAKLGLGKLQDGTGTWLIGAFELALGRYTEATRAFDFAREHYVAAKAPGLVLLTRVRGKPRSSGVGKDSATARWLDAAAAV
jgi:hypothetical protein